jgi:hypothetical protein
VRSGVGKRGFWERCACAGSRRGEGWHEPGQGGFKLGLNGWVMWWPWWSWEVFCAYAEKASERQWMGGLGWTSKMAWGHAWVGSSFCQKLARPNSRIDLEIILSDYYIYFLQGKSVRVATWRSRCGARIEYAI